MINIDAIHKELGRIPHAYWGELHDPFVRPRIFGDPRKSQRTHKEINGQPLFGGNEDFEYPDWIDSELLTSKDREVQQGGIDALAWYVSFHASRVDWGIYIPVSSLIYMEKRYFRSIQQSRFTKWQSIMDTLIEHELFHFATDYMVSQWEILIQRPCWTPMAARRSKVMGRYLEVEEKLANAYMLRALQASWTEEMKESIRSLIMMQPAGYNEAYDFTDEDKFRSELEELTKSYIGLPGVERDLHLMTSAFDFSSLFPVFPRIEPAQCPVHIINDGSQFNVPDLSLQFITCIPAIVETRDFKKKYAKLNAAMQKQWEKTKKELASQIPRHPEFEKLKSGLYSVRLNKGYRAHLRPPTNGSPWEAIAVGNHTEMGHD